MNFQALEQGFDVVVRGQYGGNCDQSAQRLWHTVTQGQTGQDRRTNAACHEAVDQGHRHIEGGDEAQQRQPLEGPTADATRVQTQ